MKDILEELLNKINPSDIKISQDDSGFTVEVDDETETYRALVTMGKSIKADATDQEAFEAAMTQILSNYAAE